MEKRRVSKEERGRQASIEGFAHEHIVAGILMKKYQNVSLVDLPLSPYDIIIVLKRKEGEEIIRAQVKTAKKSINFTGGSRGGIDRLYISGVKTYVHSTKTADVIVGIRPLPNGSYELYFVPTVLVELLKQKSISLRKIQALKYNYDLLENCKNREYVIKKCREYGILKES